MSQRLRRKGLYALAAFVSLAAVLQQFLSVYHFEDRQSAVLVTGAVCLALALLPKVWLRLPVVLLLFALGIYRYFPLGQTFGPGWLAAVWRQLRPLVILVRAEGFGRTPSLLAFSLIMAAVVLLAALIIEYEHFLVSYLLMLGYLLLLVVFNHLDPLLQLFLVTAGGFFSYGLKQNRKRGLQSEVCYTVGGLLLLVLLGVGVRQLPDTLLRDPLAKQTVAVRNYFNEAGLYSYIESVGVGGNTRTGFSEDDEALGGAMVDDDTLLFTAEQLRPHYWRVDSKDDYTGKGWQRQQAGESIVSLENRFTPAMFEPLLNYPQQQRIDLEFMTRNTYLPLPYGDTTIGLISGFLGFEYSHLNQRVDLIPEEAPQRRVYLETKEPDYPVEKLEATKLQLPEDEVDYLQLPKELPQRIGELAQEVTKEQSTMYEKVAAVEAYLSGSPNFRYSKVDAVAPLPDQDYVDQFLFETRVGYCDNFSSAMVVMLRSLGIPARWVKGFSQGEARPSFEPRKVYEIKNLNAHSWPEVYFAGYGWIPFEPTPSFRNPDRPGTAVTDEETQASQAVEEASTPASSSESAAVSESTAASTTESLQQTASSAEAGTASDQTVKRDWGMQETATLAGGLLLASAVGFFLWQQRLTIGLWGIMTFSRDPFAAGYLFLLKEWERLLWRQPSENLQHYAQRLATVYPEQSREFVRLTVQYEAYLYSSQSSIENSRDHLQAAEKELYQVQKAAAKKRRTRNTSI